MWGKLEEIFEEIGIPYSRQGSYGETEELPSEFYTFWQTRCEPDDYYCNQASTLNHEWVVFYYTSNPETLYSGLENFIKKAEEKGFYLQSMQDISCDEPSFNGRFCKITYKEQLNN